MAKEEKLLIVDDEKSMRDFLEIMFKKEGYKVATSTSAEDGLALCDKGTFDLIITDIKMGGMDGVSFVEKVKEVCPETTVIVITAYASIDNAVKAMKVGAYDYISKPFNVDEVKLIVRKALDMRQLEKENIVLKKELKQKYGFANLIGISSKMVDIYNLIKRVASTKSNILITGESGTGKELVARAIHYEGDRKGATFIAVNCGAIPENLIESEMFGHQKGAFTGAIANKSGLFEAANSGTIFLDEITELPLHTQVKLLRVIQERSFRRVGGIDDISVDVRIIAASNRDIEDEVKEGRFREDLFYRLNVIPIYIPALRERREDVPMLADHFLEKYRKELGKDIKKISEEAVKILLHYNYPGNVRELENIIERAVALEASDIILPESLPENLRYSITEILPSDFNLEKKRLTRLPFHITEILPSDFNLEKTIESYEKEMFLKALKMSGGVKTKAAKLLGLSFRSLRYKFEKYGL
ncbi:MAG: Fis family transcriptional regulator [Deltaproteobacteria bacterium GWC2_42_11]|nr:MAG: Fis family transcriptional regulator [Deltaproteobacteria bacterium GWC2_42_11]